MPRSTSSSKKKRRGDASAAAAAPSKPVQTLPSARASGDGDGDGEGDGDATLEPVVCLDTVMDVAFRPVALVDRGAEREVMAAALIDRLVHHCHIVAIRGNSYRMRQHTELWQALHTTSDPDTGPRRRRARQEVATN